MYVTYVCWVNGKRLPQQPEVAQGVPGRLRPRIFLAPGTTKVVGRQPYAPAAWYSFLEAESTPRHMVLSVATEKKSPVTPPGIDPETVRLVAQVCWVVAGIPTYVEVELCKYFRNGILKVNPRGPYLASGGRRVVADDLERIWKEAGVA